MGMIMRNKAIIFLFLLILLFFLPLFLHAASSITQGKLIEDGDTLVSDGLNFELGFFNSDPENSTLRYVGIWYYKIPGTPVIWVANRRNPISGNGGSITIGADGNLVIFDENSKQIWSSNASIPLNSSNSSVALLHDTGELVIQDKNNERIKYWTSFDHPTDTFLPGMKVRVNSQLGESHAFHSWKSETDPSPGNYTMGVDPEASPQIVIWEGKKRRWRSGYWDGRIFTGVSNMTSTYLYGFRLSDADENSKYISYSPLNSSDRVRFLVTWNGYEKQFRWNEGEKHWSPIQWEPYRDCEFYNKCGSYAVCDSSNSPVCSCLKGFEPKHLDQWNNRNWSGGCKRKTPLKAERNSSSGMEEDVGEDGFLAKKCMKLPDFARLTSPTTTRIEVCQSACFQNVSCIAFAYVNGIGCMMWYGDLMDIQQLENGGNTLHIRLAHSDLGDGRKKIKVVIISVVVVGLVCLAICAWLIKRFKGKFKVLPTGSGSCCKNDDIPIFESSKSIEFSTDFSGSGDGIVTEGGQMSGPDLPLFNFACISIATNNFSEENKLGQGGFGPVYKGMLRGGEEIAVKRLSRRSGQGLEEFKNEMMLIAKLQHRNLVRLMGCSIKGDEKLLIYEYMPNKSLDCFLFNPTKQTLLDWKKRFSIIEGIARGLLYLHRDSRLRIIHRDLKASNILLDEDMNPKISDFGLARIFGGNQNEANTTRVVGTYGYMSPEYAMEGLFSVKSDVYSFGVLLLEIISGRRNTSFRQSEDSSLIGYAWHLWNENRAMELVNPSIRDSTPENEALRCIQIGMLCVEDSAAHRPNMSSVVLMLESEPTALPWPRQPTLASMRRSLDRDQFYADGLDASNNLTVTMVVGR